MPRKNSKSKSTLPTANVPMPGVAFLRHLRTLGLDTASAYRAWCRQNGFGTVPYKSGRQRRLECRVAQKLAVKAQDEAVLLRHLAALRLETEAEYDDWRRQRGLHGSPKRPETRRRELEIAQQEAAQAVMRDVRRQMRRPEELLPRLYKREIPLAQIRTDYLRQVADIFKRPLKVKDREAFLRLLLHTQKVADFTSLEPVLSYIGPQPGNTCVEGLLALARQQGSWLRPLEDWKPNARSARQQFGSLARHLLADYPVPACMDAAWFLGDTEDARRKQDWFKHIGLGLNIRRANLPLPLTEKAAHYFQFAPQDFSIEAAFRWGQIRAMGGSEALARAVVASRIGERFDDEAFWITVLHFFVNNPTLAPSNIGPIVDYIHYIKFVADMPEGPQEPEFAMKGRTPRALLERVEEWHQQLARAKYRRMHAWKPSGIEEFHWRERSAGGMEVYWNIREILNVRMLAEEGKAMRHCIRTYESCCRLGACSIWSLRVKEGDDKLHRMMTISVSNAPRRVTEARGKCNILPSYPHTSPRLQEAPRLLNLWAQQQGLTVACPL